MPPTPVLLKFSQSFDVKKNKNKIQLQIDKKTHQSTIKWLEKTHELKQNFKRCLKTSPMIVLLKNVNDLLPRIKGYNFQFFNEFFTYHKKNFGLPFWWSADSLFFNFDHVHLTSAHQHNFEKKLLAEISLLFANFWVFFFFKIKRFTKLLQNVKNVFSPSF